MVLWMPGDKMTDAKDEPKTVVVTTTGQKETTGKIKTTDDGIVRVFESGATRDTSHGKHDPEGFLSPLVIERFCEYMHKNRLQSDGSLRDSDNWQHGFGFPTLMKSIWRHFLDVWKLHRGIPVPREEKGEAIMVGKEDALCGLMFNSMAYLHEVLVKRGYGK